MTKNPSNPTQTVILLGVLFLILGLGGTYYYFLPQLVNARSLEVSAISRNEGLLIDIGTLRQAQADMGSAKTSLESQGVDFNDLRQHYPQFEEVPNLYLQIEELIKESPDVLEFTYQIGDPISIEGEGVKIPLTASGVGSYTHLKEFLGKLEENVRPFSLNQVTFAEYTPPATEVGQVSVPDGSYSLTIAGFARAEKLSPSYVKSE